MKNIKIGQIQQQPSGYKAFVPCSFPPQEGFCFSPEIIQKANQATLVLGRLDGITQLLPDVDFFLFMYIRKDAASSNQIEGTRATFMDAIEAEANIRTDLPKDVDDIIHYIHAVNHGLKRMTELPFSLRFIKELHLELMKDARSTQFAYPGEIRTSQNWIGGTSPNNASFVPPPPNYVINSLGELESFLHNESQVIPLLKIGLIHAQFETIHPFNDGNGRTGRLLITMLLCLENLLHRPVLFLSSFFHKHQSLYYDMLNAYHNGHIELWLEFFLDGVIEIGNEAIETVKQVTQIRKEDEQKILSLGKTASKSAVQVLPKLFELPIVDAAKIQQWTGYTAVGAKSVIDRFIEMGILEPHNKEQTYGRSYIYRRYVDVFLR